MDNRHQNLALGLHAFDVAPLQLLSTDGSVLLCPVLPQTTVRLAFELWTCEFWTETKHCQMQGAE